MASKSAADDNDLETARSRGRAAMWVSIVGIIISVLLIVVVLILYFVVGFNLYAVLMDVQPQEQSDEYGRN